MWRGLPSTGGCCSDLYRRGLIGEGLDMICVDGGTGLLAATLQVKAPLREGRLQERSNI